MKRKLYSDFTHGKWYVQYSVFSIAKDMKTYEFVPIYFSLGIGRLRDRLMYGIWFSLCLFNRNIDEGAKLPGLHIIIPIKRV